MWGYGILWIVFAVVTIAAKFPRINFSMAWWGFTFPLGICFVDEANIRHLFVIIRSTWKGIGSTVLQCSSNNDHSDRHTPLDSGRDTNND